MHPTDDIPRGAEGRALLEAAQAGNEEALVRLVAPYRRGLALLCGLMLGDTKKAHRAMIQTMRAASSGITEVSSPAAIRMWIHRIAIRVCLQTIGSRPDDGGSTEIDRPTARMRQWHQSAAGAPPRTRSGPADL